MKRIKIFNVQKTEGKLISNLRHFETKSECNEYIKNLPVIKGVRYDVTDGGEMDMNVLEQHISDNSPEGKFDFNKHMKVSV